MMLKSLILATFISVLHAYSTICESGWEYFRGSCYKQLDTHLPWTVSEFKCLFQGAHHVSIGSDEENQFVSDLVNHQELFLGSAVFGRSLEYVNSDRTPFGMFENWETGSRPAINKARRCVKMTSSGKWYQSCCKKLALAVCEKAAPVQEYFSSTDFRRRYKFRQ